MQETIRFQVTLAAAVLLACAVGFAQSGEATYKAKCANCHGAAGIPTPGMAKGMGVKPVTDPAVKSNTEAKMIAITTNGAGKMPAYKGKLADAQIKEAVAYFRTLAK
jgi:cytochrome c6